ncbi:MAG: diphthine--ammonia ligase [bacterium]|nr:diphthine--ammonia ligase [bacterium]
MAVKVAALYSGGKDSTFALQESLLKGFEVRCLIILQPARPDSWMFHYPNIAWTRLQAAALRIPAIFWKTSGEKEKELEDLRAALLKAIEKYNIEGVVSGALCSDYQRMRIALVCEELGLKSYTPFWRKDQKKYMQELLKAGIEFIITSITCYGLPLEYLGKVITWKELENLLELAEKYSFNPAFEGGEAETFVIYAPVFSAKIKILEAETVRISEHEGYYIIRAATLEQASTAPAAGD